LLVPSLLYWLFLLLLTHLALFPHRSKSFNAFLVGHLPFAMGM
jgi:hypothetical protein